jgi:hypothetical protein
VKVPTVLKLVGAAKVHPQRLEVTALTPLSLARTVCGPALRPAGTRVVTLNIPLAATGAVSGVPPATVILTVPVSALLTALVVGIQPDPVICNSWFGGPADGVSVMVGAATTQDPVLITGIAASSEATTVYVPGFSGGTTMVVVIVPLGGIVFGPVIGAQVAPNITVARCAVPVLVNPEPWRVTTDPGFALLGVSVSVSAPTVMSAFAELSEVGVVGSAPWTAHT